MSEPERLGLFVIEKSRSYSLTHLFSSKPFNRAWFNSLTEKLDWSTFSHSVLVSMIPGSSRRMVDFILSHLFSSSPVWYFETLENGSGSSVERDILDSISKSRWMEVLSINMMHMHWLLMEFLVVEVINSNTYFSSLFDMESVGDKGKVWVNKSHELADTLLNGRSWVEEHFDPAKE
jgi:hypothetical protein